MHNGVYPILYSTGDGFLGNIADMIVSSEYEILMLFMPT